jgi:hypothetical protein
MPFVKGQSGNPAGRKPGQLREIQNLAAAARKFAPMALRTIAKLCRESETETVRLAAANSLLDRGYGKPAQSIDLAGELTMLHQMDMFGGLGLDDQRRLQDALRTIDRDESLMIEHQDHAPESDEEPFFDPADAEAIEGEAAGAP